MGIVKSKEKNWDLKGHFKKLKEDLKPMTFKEKADHIWTYYKEYMLVAFCVLFIIIGAMVAFFTPRQETIIAGVQCNMKLSNEGYDYLTEDFQSTLPAVKNGKTVLHTLQFYGEGTVEAVEQTTQAYYSVTAYVEAKELDYMLLDLYSFRYFGSDRIYMDLRDILTGEEIDALAAQGLILYEESDEEVVPIPRAIDISKTEFCQKELGVAECYLVFIRNTPRLDTCKKLWEHIKNYK